MFYYYRVEGHGSATILDVTYFTHEIESDKSNHDDNSYMAAIQCVADKERELRFVQFRQEAVEKQKDMLRQFASHITNLESGGDKVALCIGYTMRLRLLWHLSNRGP